MKKQIRNLGSDQKLCYQTLQKYTYWTPGCGFVFDNAARTIRILDSLVALGLVEIQPSWDGKGKVYVPVEPDRKGSWVFIAKEGDNTLVSTFGLVCRLEPAPGGGVTGSAKEGIDWRPLDETEVAVLAAFVTARDTLFAVFGQKNVLDTKGGL